MRHFFRSQAHAVAGRPFGVTVSALRAALVAGAGGALLPLAHHRGAPIGAVAEAVVAVPAQEERTAAAFAGVTKQLDHGPLGGPEGLDFRENLCHQERRRTRVPCGRR
jgi:hypothetical protein